MTIQEHDHEPIRCPKLGHEVDFKYCRIMNNRLPCGSIIGCWQRLPDLGQFLAEHYTKQELDRIFTPPRAKVETLVEMIEKAKGEKAGR